MTAERVDAALEGATLVYFDGRLTEAALIVARAAKAKGIKVLYCSAVIAIGKFISLICLSCSEDQSVAASSKRI